MSELKTPGVENLSFETADALLDALSPRNRSWGDDPSQWIFRGQANAAWKLVPSAVRDSQPLQAFDVPMPEYDRNINWIRRKYLLDHLLERFHIGLDRSGLIVPGGSPRRRLGESVTTWFGSEPEPDTLPLMALAQHHGLPTLFLDWTRRAVVAAYFAAVEAADPKRVGKAVKIAVWALERGRNRRDDEHLRFYEAPAGSNPNLHAQSGLFTLFADESDCSIEEYLSRESLEPKRRMRIRYMTMPVSEAPKLLRMLHFEGIDGASMFPGVDGVVRAMRERVLWDRP